MASGFSNNGSQYVFTLVRYNTDGSLDPTFGLTGIVTTASAPSGKAILPMPSPFNRMGSW